MLSVDVDLAVPGWQEHARDWSGLLTSACQVAARRSRWSGLADSRLSLEVAFRLSSNADVQALNRDFRGKDQPTNVLAFPQLDEQGLNALAFTDDGAAIIGDVILALECVQAEAQAQSKTVADHAVHLAVHGLLHLLGYDHQNPAEAEVMEDLERLVLAQCGIADPYRDDDISSVEGCGGQDKS